MDADPAGAAAAVLDRGRSAVSWHATAFTVADLALAEIF
jgi:hypothetical protein